MDEPVSYELEGEKHTLLPDDSFIGYFRMMNGRLDDGSWSFAYIIKLAPVNDRRKLFRQCGEAIFQSADVNIQIKALRGPKSMTKQLPEKYQHYEVWNIKLN